MKIAIGLGNARGHGALVQKSGDRPKLMLDAEFNVACVARGEAEQVHGRSANDCHQRQDNGKRSAAVGLSAAWRG
mgnify:CR=1 FL=1